MLQVGASETNPGLDLGELRLDLAFAYGAGSWTGPRPCGELPAAACRQTEGAALQQEQSLDLLRVQAGVTLGLPVGLQFTVGLPVDLRVTRTRWSSGGLRLTPEWSGSDAFDGVTGGLGDVQLLFGIVDSPVGVAGLVLGAHLGTSIPTGTARSDPGAQDLSLPARVRAFGTGTVDPMVRLLLFYTGPHIGFLATGAAQVPLYRSKAGFLGSRTVTASLGPTLQLEGPLRPVQVRLLAEASLRTVERWFGEVVESSGRAWFGIRMGLSWNISPRLALHGSLGVRAFEQLDGAQFNFPVTGQVGITGFIQLPQPKRKDEEPVESD